jgi:hypothetical protein
MSTMSRRDDGSARALTSRRSSPAGASPASVSAGAPSSRPQTRDESRAGQAGCQEPRRREPVRGPQHHVKLAASIDLQPERRAGHFAAKTISGALQSGDARAQELGGVRSAARGQGEERNTRGPSAQPGSGPRASDRPTVKLSAAQRESEGTVVVPSRATNNARGAKGPCGSSVGRVSTREGMTGRTGSNSPGGRESIDKVRQLQRRLWSVAKRQPDRRFHALYDRIYMRPLVFFVYNFHAASIFNGRHGSLFLGLEVLLDLRLIPLARYTTYRLRFEGNQFGSTRPRGTKKAAAPRWLTHRRIRVELMDRRIVAVAAVCQ